MPPQVTKSRGSEMPFLVHTTESYYIHGYNPFGIKVLNFISYFLQFLGTSELSILHCVFFYENLTKISQHESKSGFFLSRSHTIGRDSGFSSKIGIIATKSGWLDSLRTGGFTF